VQQTAVILGVRAHGHAARIQRQGRGAEQGGAPPVPVRCGVRTVKGRGKGKGAGCRVGPAGHREEEKIEKGKGAGWACWADFGFRGPHT
jgi:hypothetical protein